MTLDEKKRIRNNRLVNPYWLHLLDYDDTNNHDQFVSMEKMNLNDCRPRMKSNVSQVSIKSN